MRATRTPLLLLVLALVALPPVAGAAAADGRPTCDGQAATIWRPDPHEPDAEVFTFTGTPGDDVIVGTAAADAIAGLGGRDTVCGRGGADTIGGHALFPIPNTPRDDGAADRLFGEGDNDYIVGGDGDDRLAGGAAHDVLFGEGGDDRFAGGAGDDQCLGGRGRDRADASCERQRGIP